MPTKDGDPHYPYMLQKRYKETKDKVIAAVKRGLPPRNAFISVGIAGRQYDRWYDMAVEDIEAGFTDTPLIKFMTEVAQANEKIHERLIDKSLDLADEGDTSMIQFLLKTRYGYDTKKKTEVELSGNKKAPVTFQIVDMKPLENDEE